MLFFLIKLGFEIENETINNEFYIKKSIASPDSNCAFPCCVAYIFFTPVGGEGDEPE